MLSLTSPSQTARQQKVPGHPLFPFTMLLLFVSFGKNEIKLQDHSINCTDYLIISGDAFHVTVLQMISLTPWICVVCNL